MRTAADSARARLALLLRSLACSLASPRSSARLVRQIINCQALRARQCYCRSSPGTSVKLESWGRKGRFVFSASVSAG